MFSRTAVNLLIKGAKTLDHFAKRVGPRPIRHLMSGRRGAYQARFKDMGPYWSTVWVALKTGTRQKRHGKSHDKQRDRFVWRPIERGYQNLYSGDISTPFKRHFSVPRPRLRASNTEIGKSMRSADGYHFNGKEKYGLGPYLHKGGGKGGSDFRVF